MILGARPGRLSKWRRLIAAAMDAGFTGLVVVAILNSVLSLAVHLRIVVALYRYRQPGDDVPIENASMLLLKRVCVVAFVFTLGIGLAAQALLGTIG